MTIEELTDAAHKQLDLLGDILKLLKLQQDTLVLHTDVIESLTAQLELVNIGNTTNGGH